MKLIIHFKGYAIKIRVLEKDLDSILEYIRKVYSGVEQRPLNSELYRLKINGGVIVLYKKNKRERTRSEWLEYRALIALSRIMRLEFMHSVLFNINSVQREIDGVNFDERVMVEVHWGTLDSEWLKYYIKKRDLLGFQHLIIICRSVNPNTKIPPDVDIYLFRLDNNSIYNYYKYIEFPSWIKRYLGVRHIRILTTNGHWIGFKKRLTKTPKYTPEEKFRREITKLYSRNYYPLKIYYSIARMINPIGEYHGRGYPLPYVIGVLDIDTKISIIAEHNRYLSIINKNIHDKLKIVREQISSLGYKTKTLFSGKKGYHVYIMDNDELEFHIQDFKTIISNLGDIVDNANFRDKQGNYDLHRIIKLPNTIDQTTGFTISEKTKQIPKDKLIPYTKN